MTPALLLALSSALLPAATGEDLPTIKNAQVTLAGERLSIWVHAGTPLDPKDAYARVDGRVLSVSLEHTRLQRNRAFTSEDGTLVWAEHKGKRVELQMPLVGGMTCAGSVQFRSTTVGLEARATCRKDAVAAAPAEPAEPRPSVIETPAPAPVVAAAAPAPASAPVKEEKPDAPRPVATASVAPPASTALLAVACLGILGALAFFLAKRRHQGSQVVEVLQSHALGPKRALIVARVAGKTMVLSSSEAGIQLLSTSDVEAAAPRPAPQRHGGADGLVASLTAMASRSPKANALAKSFDDILADTDEDQAIRRKLAAGHLAKVA